MFLTSYIYAPIAFCVGAMLYAYVFWRKPDVNWGSSRYSVRYQKALRELLSMRKLSEQLSPESQTDAMNLLATMRKGYGAVMRGEICVGSFEVLARRLRAQRRQQAEGKSKAVEGY